MFIASVVLAIYLLYFYYMTRRVGVSQLSKPSAPYISSHHKFTQQLKLHGSNFRYLVNNSVVWEAPLPDLIRMDNGKFSSRDVCFGQPDGSKQLATGQSLYENVQNYQLIQDEPHFESNALTTAQDKHMFYFTCKDSRIHQLHMCPPGHVFKHDACQPIDACHDQRDGTRFADNYSIQSYFECHQNTAIHKRCPTDKVFLHDHCASSTESALYCQFHTEPKILDSKTLLLCQDHKATYETCPPGFRYFDKPYCESNVCDGQRDGDLVPMPKVNDGPFTYSQGFMGCENNKIVSVEYCPGHWDPHMSKGDNLTHLPQVFDGKKCAIPSFCDNVTSSDPDTIVPVHRFTKKVQNWKYSSLLDSLAGYKCEGGGKKRVNMEPGNRINKRFKGETACDGVIEKVPIPGRPDAFYDCQKAFWELCPPDHYFDAETCVPRIPNAFSYNGIDFFTFNSLRVDNWMPPWDYNKKPLATPCREPESVWMELYNICSHPDCTKYPFLSQISYELTLRDGSQCVFRESDRRLVKTDPLNTPYLYWNQRKMLNEPDTCIPGKNIESGHFVWDSTIYMTCDENQPFLFCPSSDTRGVLNKDGYACVPSSMRSIIPPNTKVEFTSNEVKFIRPLQTDTIVLINNKDELIPKDGFINPQNAFTLETIAQGVQVEYQHRVSYPPNTYVMEDGTIRGFNNNRGYIMKLDGFTRKPIEFPKYDIKKSISHFVMKDTSEDV